MADVVSTIVMDTSQAEPAVKRLTAVQNQLAASSRSVAAAQGQIVSSSPTPALNAAAKATKQVTSEQAKLAKQTTQTLEAFVRYNIVNQVFNRLSRGIRDSVNASRELELQIARVQTLTQRSGTGAITEGVLDISNAFGIDAIKVADAAYLALSNQVGNLSESLEFTAKTAQLAKAGFADLADVGNLVSGIMNSYNLEVNNVNRIQDELFRSVELGRVTIQQLAGSLGVLTKPAAQLGIEFREIAAAVSAITISGVETDTAITGLRNTMFSLLKPSTALKAAMQELEISSVESGIAIHGLIGFLEEIQGTTQGTSAELAELFTNLRAFQGASALLGGQQGLNTLQQFNKELDGVVARAQALVEATDADKFQKNINSFRNVLTKEVGNDIVQFTNSLISAFGGADAAAKTLAATLRSVAPVMAVLIAQFTATTIVRWIQAIYLGVGTVTSLTAATQGNTAAQTVNNAAKTAGVAASTAATAANAAETASIVAKTRAMAALALTGFNVVAVAVAIGFGIGLLVKRFLDARNGATDLVERFNEIRKIRLDKLNEDMERLNINAQEAARLSRQQASETITSLEQMNAAYRRHVAETESSQRVITQGFRNQAQDRVNVVKRMLDQITSAYLESDKVIRNLEQGQRDFANRARAAIVDFNLSQIQDPRQLADALRRESDKLLDAARKTQSPEERLRFFDDALARATQMLNVEGQDRQAVAQINRVQQERELIIKSIVDQEQKLTAEAQKQEGFIGKQAARLEALLNELEGLEKSLGEAPTAEAQDRITNQMKTVAKNFTTTLKDLEREVPEDVLKKFIDPAELKRTFGQFRNVITGQLGDFDVLIGANQLALRKSVEDALAKSFDINVRANLEAATGIDLAAAGPGAAIQAATKQGVQRETALLNAPQVTDALRKLESATSSAINTMVEEADKRSKASVVTSNLVDDMGRTIGKLRAIDEEAVAAAQKLKLAAAAIDRGDFDTATRIIEENEEALKKVGVNTSQLGTIIQETIDAQKNYNNKLLELEFDATNLNNLDKAVKDAGDKISQNNSIPQALNDGAPPIRQASSSLAAAIQAGIAAVQGAAASGSALGGRRGFALGGRGTDTIPAMLSPGEFVVNSRATREFFPQLMAMNSMQQPIYRQQGGEVNNTTVGDINVNVRGEVNGRQIAEEIRREIKRGTVRL